MFFDINKVTEYFWQKIADIEGGMRYKEARLTKDEWVSLVFFPVALSFLIGGCFWGCTGVYVGLLIGVIIALFGICHRIDRKHQRAERAFLNKLKAKGIVPKVERIALPRDAQNPVIVYVRGYSGEFWRCRRVAIDEYVIRGEIIDNKVVLTYEHRDKDGRAKGYDTIRIYNVYKELVSETH